MGWFFGCFGGSGKKGRKHKTPPSPLPKQQTPLYAAPALVRVPAGLSSSIPIKATPGQERPSHEDLFRVCQLSSSAPTQNIQGAFLQNALAGSQAPERQRKPGPWYQLDDLEEELEDLRKQIDKESQDTKKIKEEVSFFKSCGSLIKTPSEPKSLQKVDIHQGSMPEGGWRQSWRAPSASPNEKSSTVKNFQFEGLKAALCDPTPTKECHSLLFGVQTPVSSTRGTQSNEHQSITRPQVQEESKNGAIPDTEHDLLPSQDGIKHKPSSDMNPAQKVFPMSSPIVDDDGIHNRGEGFGNMLEVPKDILKQANRSVCAIESSAYTDDIEIENNSTKKRRLAVNMASVQALKKPLENDVGNVQDYNALCQKRLKVIAPVEQSRRDLNNSLSHADPVPVHFFRCESLSPIMESGASIEESTSYGNAGVSQGPSHQLRSYNSNNSASQTLSQSPSLRQSPASQTKSVTYASTNDEDYTTTDELSYNRGAVEKYSEGSYTNSTCFNGTNEEDEDAASYSSLTDSEETLSDLSPEHCFSPPLSPSHGKSSSVYRTQDNSASSHGLQTAKIRSISSTRYSTVYGGRKKQHVSRYDSEEDDITEDDHDLFTDAMSHVSTECSEGERGRWHTRTESTDSVSTHFAHSGRVTDLNLIDTPPKLSEGLATPNIDIPGRAGQHTSRLRSKPASSVLTPVENVSQWKQLKERDHKLDASAKAGSDELSKKRAENPRPNVWDENKNSGWTSLNKAACKLGEPTSVNVRTSHWGPTADAKSVNVNASLSHWAVAPKAESVRVASDAKPVNVSASFSHWGIAAKAESTPVDASLSQEGATATTETEHVRVDMSLSHWLKSSSKLNEAHKPLGSSTTTTTSSSGEGAVVSPAPKLQTKDYASPPNSATRTLESQFSSYVASERPILGALGGDYSSSRNAKQRSPWDGKGTPNTTAKYKEDQRIKWRATPFEQRLEQALDKQGVLLQRKVGMLSTAS